MLPDVTSNVGVILPVGGLPIFWTDPDPVALSQLLIIHSDTIIGRKL